MTIKIEFPAERKDVALAIGKALTEIGQSACQPRESGLINGLKQLLELPADASDTALFSRIEALALELEQPGGPFYWLHPESESCGKCHTWDQLQRMMDADPLVERVTKSSYDVAATVWGDCEPDETDEAGNAGAATHEPKAEAAHAVDNVDEKGVPFNSELCSKAAIPFYGSGKKKGQWKKRQGVNEEDYDQWYADALLGVKIETVEDTAQAETTSASNVAACVFGNQQASAGEDIPQDAGQLMKWVSEQQAAGNITQQQVTDAYTALQLPFDSIMNPAHPIAENCAAIYNHLKGQV